MKAGFSYAVDGVGSKYFHCDIEIKNLLTDDNIKFRRTAIYNKCEFLQLKFDIPLNNFSI